MALQMIAEKQAKTAQNKIGGFDVQYDFEHLPGEKPDVIRARGTVEGSNTIVDAQYFPEKGNFSSTFHYIAPETNVAMLAEVLADMRKLAATV